MNCFRRSRSSHRCSVVLLDGTEISEEIRDDTLGQEMLDEVLRQLRIQETSYFGLRYMHASRQPHWLHPNKTISKQLKGTSPFTLYFCVKFYATDPCKLRDEITRYQFFLQVKKDMLDGRLPVPPELTAELSASVAQSELGDYDPSVHGEGYCRQLQLNPSQPAPEDTISALHRSLKGRRPAEAEAALLEKVRWLDMYGADLYPVMGENDAETFVGLAPSGVLVLRGRGRVTNYFWPRIIKVLCKKNSLVIRTRDNNNEEQTISFRCESRLACQLLLQNCLEQEEFSRQALVNPPAARASKGSRSEGRRGSAASSSSQRQRGRRETGRLSSTDPDQPPTVSDNDVVTSSTCHKSVSVPQPVQSASSLYHRASSVNRETQSPPGSPRSVHSALLSTNRMASLFNTKPITKSRSRTSVDSQTSADSRTQRRRHHRRDPSAGSSGDASSGASSVRSSRRYRNRRPESGSDSDRSGGSKRHRSRRHRHQPADELVDSEAQWHEVQRLQAERLRPSGYQNSGMETETELSYQPKRRVKRHSRSRSRSRSPETNRNRRLPPELRRHLQFGLVEPPADPAADLQYTQVTTEQRLPRIRYAAKRSQKGGSVDGRSDVASEPVLSVAPQQQGTADGTLPPTAAYPAPSVAYPAPAATYTAPGVPYLAPTAAYPTPAAVQQPARAAAAAAASYHARTSASERSREMAAPAPGRESSPAAVGPGHPRLTSGQVALPTDSLYDNSDSGLGNESPTEFTRLSAQTSLTTGAAGPRAVASQGEPMAVRTLDTVTSL